MCAPSFPVAPQAAGGDVNPYWIKTWEGAKEPPEIFVVDKHPYGDEVKGWTTCDKDKRACQIILLRNADREYTEAHERKHASGWDHPNYPRHIAPTDSTLDIFKGR